MSGIRNITGINSNYQDLKNQLNYLKEQLIPQAASRYSKGEWERENGIPTFIKAISNTINFMEEYWERLSSKTKSTGIAIIQRFLEAILDTNPRLSNIGFSKIAEHVMMRELIPPEEYISVLEKVVEKIILEPMRDAFKANMTADSFLLLIIRNVSHAAARYVMGHPYISSFTVEVDFQGEDFKAINDIIQSNSKVFISADKTLGLLLIPTIKNSYSEILPIDVYEFPNVVVHIPTPHINFIPPITLYNYDIGDIYDNGDKIEKIRVTLNLKDNQERKGIIYRNNLEITTSRGKGYVEDTMLNEEFIFYPIMMRKISEYSRRIRPSSIIDTEFLCFLENNIKKFIINTNGSILVGGQIFTPVDFYPSIIGKGAFFRGRQIVEPLTPLGDPLFVNVNFTNRLDVLTDEEEELRANDTPIFFYFKMMKHAYIYPGIFAGVPFVKFSDTKGKRSMYIIGKYNVLKSTDLKDIIDKDFKLITKKHPEAISDLKNPERIKYIHSNIIPLPLFTYKEDRISADSSLIITAKGSKGIAYTRGKYRTLRIIPSKYTPIYKIKDGRTVLSQSETILSDSISIPFSAFMMFPLEKRVEGEEIVTLIDYIPGIIPLGGDWGSLYTEMIRFPPVPLPVKNIGNSNIVSASIKGLISNLLTNTITLTRDKLTINRKYVKDGIFIISPVLLFSKDGVRVLLEAMNKYHSSFIIGDVFIGYDKLGGNPKRKISDVNSDDFIIVKPFNIYYPEELIKRFPDETSVTVGVNDKGNPVFIIDLPAVDNASVAITVNVLSFF